MAHLLTTAYIKKIIAFVAKQQRIKIVEGDTWMVDIEKRELHYDNRVLDLDPDDALALLLHEIGHIKYTTVCKIQNTHNAEDLEKIKKLTNVVEDLRIDGLVGQIYSGSEFFMDRLHEIGISIAKQSLLDHKVQMARVKHNHYDKARHISLIERAKHDKSQDIKDAIADMDHRKLKADKVRGDEVYIVGLKSLMFCYGEPSYRTGDLDDIAEVVALKTLNNVDGLKNTQEVCTFVEKELLPLVKDLATSTKDNAGYAVGSDKFNGQVCHEEMPDQRSIFGEQQDYDEGSGKRLKRGFQVTQGHENGRVGRPIYKMYEDQISVALHSQKTKLIRVLKDNKEMRVGGSHYSGRLKRRGLYKFGVRGETKMFTRKCSTQGKNYSIDFLVDVSGSMGNDYKEDNAFKGLILLGDVLAKTNTPFGIRFFNDRLMTAREISTGAVDVKKFDRVYASDNGGGTELFTALAKTIESNKEMTGGEKRSVVVLTDGEVGSQERDRVLALIADNKDVSVFGLGVGTYNTKKMFGERGQDIQKSEQIPDAFIKIVKEILI